MIIFNIYMSINQSYYNQKYDNNPVFLVDGGEDTQDKVFLLSIDEVYSCFYTDYYRRCVATAYAKEHEKAYQSSTEDYTVWWLRDPGK